jgi:hypothetical protein
MGLEWTQSLSSCLMKLKAKNERNELELARKAMPRTLKPSQMSNPTCNGIVCSSSWLLTSSSSLDRRDDMLAKGSVEALPAGAVVLDAIRKCALPEAEIAFHVMTHNGELARLTSRLQNGDILGNPAVTTSVTPA